MSNTVKIQIVGYPATCLACKILVGLGLAIDEQQALMRGGVVHALPASRPDDRDLPLCEASA